MEYGLLGPLTLTDGRGPRAVAGARRHALLAVLLAAGGHAVLEDDLVDALWPDDPPRTARHTLHTHVARLRADVRADLRTVDGGYVLVVEALRTDAGRFEAALAAPGPAAADASPQAWASAAEDLRAALDLWRGPAFGRSATLAAVAPAAVRLEALRLDATEQLAARLVSAGRPQEAVTLADGLTTAHPHRESAWVLAVRARTAAGRAAEAVATHRAAVRRLDAWGLRPGAGLRAAQQEALAAPPQAVRTATPPAPGPAGTPPGTGAARTAHGVPVPVGPLVGREHDLAATRRALADARLVTLVGPGGVGKTRLALEAAAVAAPGRTRFVELGALRDGAAVPGAVVTALGLAPSAGLPAEALARAGTQDLLVVLDNAEHVVAAAAEVATALLRSPGPLRVVATSREPLRVAGEHVQRLHPLATSGDDPPARALFRARAAAAGADTADLTEAGVDRVVRLLDGLPLAVEMAAARTPSVSVADLADELTSTLTALAQPGPAAADRHRTLVAVVAWSRGLLDDDERRALDGWPVFAGAVPPADAAAVLGVARPVLERLVTRSLLLRDDAHGRTRYRMLRVVRGVLGAPADDDPLRARHAVVVRDVVVAAAARLRTADERDARHRVDDLLTDVRSAHAWACRHDVALAADLTRALTPYAVDALDADLLSWSAPLVVTDDPPSAALGAVAARAVLAGEHARGAELAARALAGAADDADRRVALETRADALLFTGRVDEAVADGDALRRLGEARGTAHDVTVGRLYRVLAAAYAGEHATARAELARMRADLARPGAALAPTTLGWCAFVAGEVDADAAPTTAIAALTAARDLADAGGNRYLGGVARAALSSVAARHAAPDVALPVATEALTWWLDAGDRTHLVTTLRNLVPLLARAGRPRDAALVWGACLDHPGAPEPFGTESARLDAARLVVVAALGDRDLEERRAAGAAEGPEAVARRLVAGGAAPAAGRA